MNPGEVFRFAFGYQAGRAWTWICFAGLGLLTAMMIGQVQGDAALDHGYFFNSPFVVANGTQVMGLLWLPIVAALTGAIAARDFESRMFPLACATPTRKASWLGGHFLAAFLLNCIVGLAMTVAFLLLLAAPSLQALLGPFRPIAYLESFALLVVPNAFIATALAFSMVVLRRKANAAYPAIALLLVMGLFGSQFIARHLQLWDLAMLLDPLALTVISKTTVAWSAAEKSTRLMSGDPMLWANRAIWIGVAGLVLAWTWHRFKLAQPEGGRRSKALAEMAAAPSRDHFAAARPDSGPRDPRRSHNVATGLRQAVALATTGFRAIAFGWPGIVLALLVVVFVMAGGELMEHIGVPQIPTTAALVELLANGEPIFVTALPLVLMLAAGELAWRDRDAGIAPLVDAAPARGWVRLAGHLGALGLLALSLQLLRVAAAMLVQWSMGYAHFEPALYLQGLFGLQLVDYLLLVVLAMALHAIVDHRHLGQLLVVAAYIGILALPPLHIGGPMLVYATGPGWTYSDMGGYANDLLPWAWYRLYWLGWAGLLALVALLFAPRGSTTGLRDRLREARARLTPGLLATGAVALLAVAAVGGVLFHNTHVRNPAYSDADLAARSVRYETRYGRYADLPQPVPTQMRLRIDLHPERGTATVEGSYTLRNPGSVPIGVIHLDTSAAVDTRLLGFDQPARRVIADDDLRHYAFALSRPLPPGASTTLHFTVEFGGRGFTSAGIDRAIAERGSAFRDLAWFPQVGYQAGRELKTAGARRQAGLPAKPGSPLLDDPAAPMDPARAQRITVDTVISTAPGHTAIAPGLLRRQWTQGGRPHFHYVTEAPIRDDLWFYSSGYQVLRDHWNGIAIEVFHHPAHPWNAERMVRAAKAVLASMSRDFGPYPYRHLRFTEVHGGGGLHAAPADVSFQEGYARFHPEADWRDVDFAFGVAGHEVAHQWWGNQLTPAMVEGAPLLSESLAWHSSLQAMRETFGEAHLQRMLGVMRDAFLTPNSRAGKPLLYAVDWLESYRKGPFAMYALGEYLGNDAMNAALRRLLQDHRANTLPLPTARDLYRELEAVTPPHLQGLLHDLLAANTYWELKATRASARPVADGRWEVTLDVSARKMTFDEAANRTPVPMDDLVEIGVYGQAADDGAEAPLLYRELHRIRDGQQRIEVTVAATPGQAGIDPRHLLPDVKPGDNLATIR